MIAGKDIIEDIPYFSNQLIFLLIAWAMIVILSGVLWRVEIIGHDINAEL